MKLRCLHLLMLLPLLRPSAPALAETEVGGHLKYQSLPSHFEENNLETRGSDNLQLGHEIDTRLFAQGRYNSFDAQIHAEALGLGGERFEKSEQVFTVIGNSNSSERIINDDRRLLDLTIETIDEEDFESVLRLDRIAVGHSSKWSVVRLGRQIISWGNGLAYHTFDFLNPFSPVEIDKDYKSGEDMLYSQLLTPWGDDLQAIIVGRREPDTRDITSKEASYALKWKGFIHELNMDYDLLTARHFDENLFGIGLSRDLYGALIRGDATLTETTDGRQVVSFIVNADRSWVTFGRNLYTFIEYFRNGFGTTDPSLLTLSDELLARLERGELFALGRDMLAVGAQLEWSARLNFTNTGLFSLHDESGFYQLRAEFDLAQDVELLAGVNLPWGPINSEFGGLLVPQSGEVLRGGEELFLRASYYF